MLESREIDSIYEAWPRFDINREDRVVDRKFYDGRKNLLLECTQLGGRPSRQQRIIKEWCEFFRKPSPVRKLYISTRLPVRLFEAICEHSSLEQLGIKWGPVKDLSPIRNLTELTCLELGTTSVDDITPLTSLKKLKHLSLHCMNRFTDHSWISHLKNLEYLSISGDSDSINKKVSIENLHFLRDLPRLKGITLHGFCKILESEWHKVILGLPNLVHVDLPELSPDVRKEVAASLPALKYGDLCR